MTTTTTLTRAAPIIGHLVSYDVIGPRIEHPVTCTALHRAVDCPHWRALDRGQVILNQGRPERGKRYVATLVHRTLILRDPEPTQPRAVRDEIHDFLDAYLVEAGSVDAVREWLKQVDVPGSLT